MSMCRVFSCVVARGCLLWPVHFLGKTLLVFALLHSVFQGQVCLLLQVFLDFLLLHSSPYNEKDIFFWVLVLKGLVGLHRTIQLQFLQRYWLGHSLGLLWYWMVCLGNEQRSFCRFWDCIQVLHFGLFCWPCVNYISIKLEKIKGKKILSRILQLEVRLYSAVFFCFFFFVFFFRTYDYASFRGIDFPLGHHGWIVGSGVNVTEFFTLFPWEPCTFL